MHYRESQAARGVAYYEDEGRGVRRNPRSSMALVQEGRCARRHPAQLSLARYMPWAKARRRTCARQKNGWAGPAMAEASWAARNTPDSARWATEPEAAPGASLAGRALSARIFRSFTHESKRGLEGGHAIWRPLSHALNALFPRCAARPAHAQQGRAGQVRSVAYALGQPARAGRSAFVWLAALVIICSLIHSMMS